ncbi:MAG: fatty acid desaturase [Gammaproteobacteria bacterium]|nr:fatty acid desaturase [Gammaproteobacteria bacterium]
MWDYLRYFLNNLLLLVAISGFVLGGQWVWLGAASFPVLLLLDCVTGDDLATRRPGPGWLYDLPVYLHLPLIFALWIGFGWRMAVGLGTEPGLPTGLAMLGCFATLVWISIVPNVSLAHEFWHRRDPVKQWIGKIMFLFCGDMNRDIAHRVTHHAHFDTVIDTDTPRRGEGVYSFALRGTWCVARDSWMIEKAKLAQQGRSVLGPHSAILWGYLLQLAIPLLLWWFGGVSAALIGTAAFLVNRLAVEAFNYIQHYGLLREEQGKPGNRHTWNHLSPVARVIAFEITNHMDHHKNPTLPFYQLEPHADGPRDRLFLNMFQVLIPPLWHARMKPRLKQWDLEQATPGERKLAAAENRRAGWPDWLADGAGASEPA